MDWIEISISTTSEGVEPVTGLILMAGIPGSVVDDPRDILRLLEDPRAARWDYADESLLGDPRRDTVVRAYVGDHAQGRRQWADLRAGLQALKQSDGEGVYGSLTCRLTHVKDEDWENNWKAYFKPFVVGDRLVVKPTWETWDGDDGRYILEIDPGSSFGTGQHHTTRMCLEMMERYIEQGETVLDIGCGSGILMIAALLLGAGYAAGVDVEETAVRTAGENLRQNGIEPDRYALYCGDLTEDGGLRERLRVATGAAVDAAEVAYGATHMIVTNIVADVIIAMAPYYAALLAPGGRLLVSGVIDSRGADVTERLEREGFCLVEQACSGEWLAFLFHRE